MSFIILQNVVLWSLVGSAVTVQTHEGGAHVGELVRLNDHVAVVRTEANEERIPIDQLLRLTNGEVDDSQTEPQIVIELVDGSLLGAASFTLGDRATLGLAEDVTLRLDPRNLRSVRFQKPDQGVRDKQWADIVQRQPEGDMLVFRKGGQNLSFLEGAIRGVTEDQVDFVLDGDDFEIDRPKVEGLYFLGRNVDTKSRKGVLVHLAGSGSLNARSIEFDDNVFTISLTTGDSIRLADTAVRSVDFAASQTVYLSTLEPYKRTVTPRMSSAILNDMTLRLIYEPAMNRSLSGRPLSLAPSEPDGPRQHFDHGMALHSRTELIYRFDEGEYGRLHGVAGIDPDLKQAGVVRLLITGDDRPLLDEEVGPNDRPLPIELDVSNVRRLQILVDYGDQTDVGDHLNLCDLRLAP